MSGNSSNSRIKLPHRVIVKSPGLLPMLYKVRELAEELSVPERTIRDWLVRGAPYQRDGRKHVWINGREFAGWIADRRKKTTTFRLMPGEGFCMSCKRVVKMVNPSHQSLAGKLGIIRGICPGCNGAVSRGTRHDQPG